MIVIANVFPKLQTVKNLFRTLFKRRRFRVCFDSQHVKASQILVNSPWQRYYHVFSSFSGKLIWKMNPLVLVEILLVFVNTYTVDNKYRVHVCENLPLPIQMQLLEKPKTFFFFFFFFFHFTNLHQILNIFKKRMIVILMYFWNYRLWKKLVRTLSKERRFRTGFVSQHVKAPQRLANSPWQRFYHVFSLFSGQLIWKISPIVLGEILGVFVNTLIGDGKYLFQDCQNLPLPIQMQISEKRKTFFEFFVPFLESTSNFQHFERKDDRHI